jgi:hypothetical protein
MNIKQLRTHTLISGDTPVPTIDITYTTPQDSETPRTVRIDARGRSYDPSPQWVTRAHIPTAYPQPENYPHSEVLAATVHYLMNQTPISSTVPASPEPAPPTPDQTPISRTSPPKTDPIPNQNPKKGPGPQMKHLTPPDTDGMSENSQNRADIYQTHCEVIGHIISTTLKHFPKVLIQQHTLNKDIEPCLRHTTQMLVELYIESTGADKDPPDTYGEEA